MVPSNNVGDRPIRRNIPLILFAALAALAVAVLLATLLFKIKKPAVAPPSKTTSSLVDPPKTRIPGWESLSPQRVSLQTGAYVRSSNEHVIPYNFFCVLHNKSFDTGLNRLQNASTKRA